MGPHETIITHIDPFLNNSLGGLAIKNFYLRKYPEANVFKNISKRNFFSKIYGFIRREIWYQKLQPTDSVLILSSIGPIFGCKGKAYFYFQNLTILEEKTLKKRIQKFYLKNISLFLKNYKLVVQNDWIIKNYSAIFDKEKSLVWNYNLCLNHNSRNPISFIYPTTLENFKNVDQLVKVFSIFSDKNVILFLTVDKRQYTKKFKHHLPNNVVFTGKISKSALNWFYHKIDYTIIASSYETLCLPLYESNFFQKKIIAPNKDYVMTTKFSKEIITYNSWEQLKLILDEISK